MSFHERAYQSDPVVIIGAKRTPFGAFQGIFSDTRAPTLAQFSIKGALDQAFGEGTWPVHDHFKDSDKTTQLGAQIENFPDMQIDSKDLALAPPEPVQEGILGCVLGAGLGQGPARQALLGAGLSPRVRSNLVNKVCGSGLQAVLNGVLTLVHGLAESVVVGGMENMTRAPHILRQTRSGFPFGHQMFSDSLLMDGLEDAFSPCDSSGSRSVMGALADKTAQAAGLTRAEQDTYAQASAARALDAAEKGLFKDEIANVSIQKKKEVLMVKDDETLSRVKIDKIPSLRPAFHPDGMLTAATSSALADGAAALVLMRASHAEKKGIKPLARIAGFGFSGMHPHDFAQTPGYALNDMLARLDWRASDLDVVEVNEAFICVPMIAEKIAGLIPESINKRGGACALGHPLGASGARIVVTLLSIMREQGLSKGAASVCIGGGEGLSLALAR